MSDESFMSSPFDNQILHPLPYHKELVGYLRDHEKPLWQWLESDEAQHDHAETVRLDLLKATYRLEATAHPRLYELLKLAKGKLDLDIDATIYQAHDTGQNNALILKTLDEAHIVIIGGLIKQLSDAEMLALLGHELGHFKFLQTDNGIYDTGDRVIATMANDPRAESSHIESERLFRLYTEIYADRAALLVCRDPLAVVAALVKSQTGLTNVCAKSYVKQTEEILGKDPAFTQGLDHPETYIRTHALMIWAMEHEGAWNQNHKTVNGLEETTLVKNFNEQNHPPLETEKESDWRSLISRNDRPIEEDVRSLITGPLSLSRLDLTGQEHMTAFTRRIIEEFLDHKWLRTEAIIGHAKLFFGDLDPGGSRTSDSDLEFIKKSDDQVKEYLAYLLLDLITVDRELEKYPLAAALIFARKLNIEDNFIKQAMKELKLRKRDITQIQKNSALLVAQVAAKNENPKETSP